MTDRRDRGADDARALQDLFVEVTGKTEITIRRDDATGRGVVDASRPETPDEVPDVDPVADGLGDAIGQSAGDSG